MSILETPARDWGFNVDTLFQTQRTSVWIETQGADTLYIDTAWVEVVEPANYQEKFIAVEWRFVGLSVIGEEPNPWTGNIPQQFWWGTILSRRPVTDSSDAIDTLRFEWPKNFYWFKTDPIHSWQGAEVTGYKPDGTRAAPNTKFVIRNIFHSKIRGTDTLMMVGYEVDPRCPTPPNCPTDIEKRPATKRARIQNAPIHKKWKQQINGRQFSSRNAQVLSSPKRMNP